MPKLTKKTRIPKVVSGNGYCRKCQKTIALSNFYETTIPHLDSNGYLSICKSCVSELYDYYFSIYGTMDKAIQFVCRDLDMRFNKEVLKQTQSHIDKNLSQGKSVNTVFGYYKSKLGSTGKNNEKMDSFRYQDSDDDTKNKGIEIYSGFETDFSKMEITPELIIFWGKGFSYEDITFLEIELSNWKQSHKCDNHAELTLLKEICIKILEIRNKRAEGIGVGQLQKELQDLMKTASVDPAKANIASSGKLQDAWGMWIKDVEQLKPAEWHDQQEKYKDMDGFIPYIKDYIVRPIKNFITGQRDFQIKDNINIILSEDEDDHENGDFNG